MKAKNTTKATAKEATKVTKAKKATKKAKAAKATKPVKVTEESRALATAVTHPRHAIGMRNNLRGVIDADRAKKAVGNALMVIHSAQAALLDIANGETVDLISELKSRGQFKQQTKMLIKAAQQAREKVWNATTSAITIEDKKSFYADLLDIFQEEAEEHITKLYWSIRQVLTIHNIEDAATRAQVVKIAAIYEIAVKSYDALIKAASQQSGLNIERFVSSESPHPIYKQWDKVAAHLCRWPQEIDKALFENNDVQLAQRILVTKLCTAEALDAFCVKVLKMHPDVVGEYLDEHPEFDTPESRALIAG